MRRREELTDEQWAILEPLIYGLTIMSWFVAAMYTSSVHHLFLFACEKT
jgi:hypothetical protein